MDESKQKVSIEEDAKDVTVKTVSESVEVPPSSAEMINPTSGSGQTDPSKSVEASASGLPTQTSTSPPMKSDSKEAPQGSDKPSSMLSDKTSGNASDQDMSPSSQQSAVNISSGDGNQTGASSEPTVSPQSGAGEPGGADKMAKMMAMMSKDGVSAMPGAPGKPAEAMPDMMAMMAKGGSMPDMMAMMAKGGGMPDMMAMMTKGMSMPDMMAMMAKGGGMPDMAAMMAGGGGSMPDMKSMKPNPLEMAKMFDCIIDVSLAKPDSESEDDDADSITIEIPCQYCSRFFSSQMALKTHILVAHDNEDSSVLNLTDLIIDSKGKKGGGSRRKQSRDSRKSKDIGAAETDALAKAVSSQEDLSAAGSRGVKRGRKLGTESEAAKSSCAAGVEETMVDSESGLHASSPCSKSEPVSIGSVADSPLETPKRNTRSRSLRSSTEEVSHPVTAKKIKGGCAQGDQDSSPTDDLPKKKSPQLVGDKSPRGLSDTAKHKKLRTEAGDPSTVSQGTATRASKRMLRRDKDSNSDTETCVQSPHGDGAQSRTGNLRSRATGTHPSVGSSSKVQQSPSPTRRSLRNHKSH